jgi:hypothetical protein
MSGLGSKPEVAVGFGSLPLCPPIADTAGACWYSERPVNELCALGLTVV